MRVLVRALSLAILFIISFASVLVADPVLVSDNRWTAALALIGDNFPTPSQQLPSAPFAPFDATVSASVVQGTASAMTVTTQRSSFGQRAFHATGMVDSSATGSAELIDAASTTGSSLFDVEFDLLNPHRFLLSAVMAVDRVDPFGTEGFGEVDVVLASTLRSGDMIEVSDGIRFGSRVLTVTGMLPAGRHRLFIEAFTESVSFGALTRHTPRFDLDFELTPTPEPGSVMLLGGGLLALASRRRRDRGRQ